MPPLHSSFMLTSYHCVDMGARREGGDRRGYGKHIGSVVENESVGKVTRLNSKKVAFLAALMLTALSVFACAGGGTDGGGSGEGPSAAGEVGDEALVTYRDPAGGYSFQYPQSWTQATDKNGGVRFEGRDSFISVAVETNAGTDVMAFAGQDKANVARQFTGYTEISLQASSEVSGAVVLSFEWDAGSSTITGKPVRARVDRYYIPAANGRAAIMTGSEPVNVFDRETVRDIALTVKVN